MTQDEIRNLAQRIVRVVNGAQPKEWTTWDVFAGHNVHHKQSTRDAQEVAVEDLLSAWVSARKYHT